VKIFLCGDVMTGRGVDQVLPHPSKPVLYEAEVRSALEYVQLAEEANGPIATPVEFAYPWGAALDELRRVRPDARIINLETAVTRSEDHLPKGINYRMSPANAGCLLAADVNCCVLANNHVLDWGDAGLLETLATLERLRIKTAGAGRDLAQARAPAALNIPNQGRVIIFALASVTSGTPPDWAAGRDSAGVNLLPDLSESSARRVAEQVAQIKLQGDIVIVSIHWGPNWGYPVPESHIRFAHRLIDEADVSIVHGHSSHHAKAIEIYRQSLILYGCGDFLNDYEGISGYENFRDDLVLMYIATVDPASADLVDLELIPFQIRRFQLTRPSHRDMIWLEQTLDRESRMFGVRVRGEGSGFGVSKQ
jgi:poly-gamma-glutamate capsule biosynthesis protein CapA/YwtB (metallophosphatase superfamily)